MKYLFCIIDPSVVNMNDLLKVSAIKGLPIVRLRQAFHGKWWRNPIRLFTTNNIEVIKTVEELKLALETLEENPNDLRT